MNGTFRLVFSIVAGLTLLLSISVLSYADNRDSIAFTKALQDQGYIYFPFVTLRSRPDLTSFGGPIGSGEMALDPFRNADQLNHGGLFGPLKIAESDSPFPADRIFFNYNHFGTPPPDTA